MVEGNVGLAFGLVIAAGCATALGAALAFITKVTDKRVLAAALGVSAGVMIYVSIVEIFTTKSVNGFRTAGHSDAEARRYSTFCFFGGMAFTWFLDKVVHLLMHVRDWHANRKAAATHKEKKIEQSDDEAAEELKIVAVADASSSDPCRDCEACCDGCCEDGGRERPPAGLSHAGCHHDEVEIPADEQPGIAAVLQADHHTGLARMGLLSALAVGIHNFPEGLATFVATLAEPTAGVAIAIAIALHNIPEGIVVAMPIYYATGSKWKGFLWSCLSGLTEPIGALVGYAALQGNELNPYAYAVMFAIVAGMMVYISLVELVPTALAYDPNNTWTAKGLVFGMLIMAASLLLFQA